MLFYSRRQKYQNQSLSVADCLQTMHWQTAIRGLYSEENIHQPHIAIMEKNLAIFKYPSQLI